MVTQEFQNPNGSTWLEVREGLFMPGEERKPPRDQLLISKKKLWSAVLTLDWKYQRSGRDYVSHVLIQAHSDQATILTVVFKKKNNN